MGEHDDDEVSRMMIEWDGELGLRRETRRAAERYCWRSLRCEASNWQVFDSGVVKPTTLVPMHPL
jgi:hypothetical protein